MDIRYKIIQAMSRLLQDQTLDGLSVSQICEEAGVSRQAFYRRFQDKYDASTWYLQQIIENTSRQVGITVGWREGFLGLFRALETNLVFHRRLVESDDYNGIYALSRRSIEAEFGELYYERFGKEPDDLMRLQIRAFALVNAETIAEWLRADCEPRADLFIDQFLTLVPKKLFETFDIPDAKLPPTLFYVSP